jgi:hypothetical protein
MKITVDNMIKDDFHSLELEDNATVEDLKVLLEVTAQVPISDQQILFNNNVLNDDRIKLQNFGINNNDIGKQILNFLFYQINRKIQN